MGKWALFSGESIALSFFSYTTQRYNHQWLRLGSETKHFSALLDTRLFAEVVLRSREERLQNWEAAPWKPCLRWSTKLLIDFNVSAQHSPYEIQPRFLEMYARIQRANQLVPRPQNFGPLFKNRLVSHSKFLRKLREFSKVVCDLAWSKGV